MIPPKTKYGKFRLGAWYKNLPRDQTRTNITPDTWIIHYEITNMNTGEIKTGTTAVMFCNLWSEGIKLEKQKNLFQEWNPYLLKKIQNLLL